MVTSGTRRIVNPSALGFVLEDGSHLGENVTIESEARHMRKVDTYATLGAHRVAKSESVDTSYTVRHLPTNLTYDVHFRVFGGDSPGVAFSYHIPLQGGWGDRVQIQDDGSEILMELEATDRAWIIERRDQIFFAGGHFSANGQYMSFPAASLWSRHLEDGITIDRYSPPVTIEDLDKQGPFPYRVIAEAALLGWEGLHFVALPDGVGFRSELTRVRQSVREYRGLWGPLELQLPVKTSWRVIQLAANLDQLVDHDMLSSLNEAPEARNPGLFNDTTYIKPGRSVWSCLAAPSGCHNRPREIEWAYIDAADALGFEYATVDIGWEEWPDKWGSVKSLTTYGKERGVGVFLWKHRGDIEDPTDNYKDLREFLDSVEDAGAVGVKMDFFGSGTLPTIVLQETICREAAKRKLLLNFHGVDKTTGEARTYPNLITQEAIWGLEVNAHPMIDTKIPPSHNAALTFTRFPSGAGDYTPLSLQTLRGATTLVHQVATLITFTSPLQTIVEDPEIILEQSYRDIIMKIPTVWDETRVLPPSIIGDLTVLARRSNSTWFLGVVSGTVETRVIPFIPLNFLDTSKNYTATFLFTKYMSDDGEYEEPVVQTVQRINGTKLTDVKLWGENKKGDGLVVIMDVVGQGQRPRREPRLRSCVIEENLDYAPGADLEVATHGYPEYLDCADWCAATEECNYWVHVGLGDDGMCFLKSDREPVVGKAPRAGDGWKIMAGNKSCGHAAGADVNSEKKPLGKSKRPRPLQGFCKSWPILCAKLPG
ncbi:unnamed protein product [Vitrella brassicaformis CCMP3155]|uniref:Apple domain-containing protein n=1 Tax=Vitrella brassicaformis (strain CCMP3155) TaxID=1169540 RepID=A0A0G4GAF3_VITBC|nr:unnamed protein product [Vitrella brassicaformis CCMP3155]|eukprot:CEM25959.1 unnamed protein product [Vitrella brassicaformis CCMP3155]